MLNQLRVQRPIDGYIQQGSFRGDIKAATRSPHTLLFPARGIARPANLRRSAQPAGRNIHRGTILDTRAMAALARRCGYSTRSAAFSSMVRCSKHDAPPYLHDTAFTNLQGPELWTGSFGVLIDPLGSPRRVLECKKVWSALERFVVLARALPPNKAVIRPWATFRLTPFSTRMDRVVESPRYYDLKKGLDLRRSGVEGHPALVVSSLGAVGIGSAAGTCRRALV